MSPLYLTLITLGLNFLQKYMESLTNANAPIEVIQGIQASISALEKHKVDVMSSADWESQRG